MQRETAECERAIGNHAGQELVDHVSNEARLVGRVMSVARQEADNSEDVAFVGRVKAAIARLEGGACYIFLFFYLKIPLI